MSKKSKITEGKISISRDARHIVVHPEHGQGKHYGKSGIGFEYGKSKLNTKSQRELKRRFENLKKLIINTPHKIKSYASRPGNKDNNMALSQARAESVKQWLIKKGVAHNRIVVSGFGEMPMVTTLAEEINPLDNFDNPENRCATIEVELVHLAPEDSQFTKMAINRIDGLHADIKKGQEPMREAIEPIADLIAKEAHLMENWFGDAPSDNVHTFTDQVIEKVKEPLKALTSVLRGNVKPTVKMASKYILGSLFDMVRNGSASEIRERRAQLYDPAAKAFAAAIDSHYQSDLSSLNPKQIAIYEHLLEKLKALPILDRYVIGALLVEKNLGGLVVSNKLTKAQIRNFFNGARIERGAKLFFERPKYSIHDSADEAGLAFQIKDGKLHILALYKIKWTSASKHPTWERENILRLPC